MAHKRVREDLEKVKAERKFQYETSEIYLKIKDNVIVTNEARSKFNSWYESIFSYKWRQY